MAKSKKKDWMQIRLNKKRTASVNASTLAVSHANGKLIRTSEFVGFLIDNFSDQAIKEMTSKNK